VRNRSDAPDEVPAAPPPESGTTENDDLERALTRALERARAAGKWDVVWLLSKELEARRDT
jgi:hypothetical protein